MPLSPSGVAWFESHRWQSFLSFLSRSSLTKINWNVISLIFLTCFEISKKKPQRRFFGAHCLMSMKVIWKHFWDSWDSNRGLLGGNRERYPWAILPHPFHNKGLNPNQDSYQVDVDDEVVGVPAALLALLAFALRPLDASPRRRRLASGPARWWPRHIGVRGRALLILK